jgi:hypothetical protein
VTPKIKGEYNVADLLGFSSKNLGFLQENFGL